MNTQKPISSISWNTESFLAALLDKLVKAHRIDFWAFIEHKPEDDEGGKKFHFHLYIEPSKRLQTADLKDEFIEFDPAKPEHPRGVLSFRNSQFADWYLYALHDEAYLTAHNQTRRFHYGSDEVRASDPDELNFRIRMIDMSQYTPIQKLRNLKQSGKSFSDAVNSGFVPIPQIRQYQDVWNMLGVTETKRNPDGVHPEVDPVTGELLEEIE